MTRAARAAAARPTVAEFFAGAGLARLGLEQAGLAVVWANDIDADKAALYRRRFGGDHLVEGSIDGVRGADLPGADVAWASFPCTDLSLAGGRLGLAGARSGLLWSFARVLEEWGERRPPVVVLENVVGFATSRGGRDLAESVAALNALDYAVDAVVLDARHFVAQSRPRLFLLGVSDLRWQESKLVALPPQTGTGLRPAVLDGLWGNAALRTFNAPLPAPPAPSAGLAGAVVAYGDDDPAWWPADRVAALTGSLSPLQAERLRQLAAAPATAYRTACRRTRAGRAVWEIRPDSLAGCLRAVRGGSSRQAIVAAGGGRVRVRWLAPREAARLMGADDYPLDGLRANQALFAFGDAVCVPAVAWLARHWIAPALAAHTAERTA